MCIYMYVWGEWMGDICDEMWYLMWICKFLYIWFALYKDMSLYELSFIEKHQKWIKI